MQKHIRYIKNRTGRRPFVCNVNKKAKSLTPAWKATLQVDGAYYGEYLGTGSTRTLALLALVNIVKKRKRSVFKRQKTA